MFLYFIEVWKEKWKEKMVGKDVYLFVFCFVLFFVVFFCFVFNILFFSKRCLKIKFFYSYLCYFWFFYFVVFFKLVYFVFFWWFKLYMVCNNYFKRSFRMFGDSVVSFFFLFLEVGLENNFWNWVLYFKYDLFVFCFYYSSV